MKLRSLFFAVAIVHALGIPCVAGEFNPDSCRFAVQVGEIVSPYRVMSFSVLPGETIQVSIVRGTTDGTIDAIASSGALTRLSAHSWRLVAPTRSGLTTLTLRQELPTIDSMTLNLFVMVPASGIKQGYLNGYRIGEYPKKPYKGLPQYRPPSGFIELPDSTFDVAVSPHFTLRQFVCKQAGGYPQYLIVRTELLLKLELVLQQVNRKGFRCNSFHVMSGFRTPYYNKAIGNVKYSRHQWGGAADIFIDENPHDGLIDDLTGDHKVDWRDAAVLYDIIDNLHDKKSYRPFVGGLGRYRRTKTHGPFVHIDVRGFRARWGE